jgi:hypothetical protein
MVLVLGVLGLLALAGALATQWLVSLRPGVTQANFERIHVGMTLPEVNNLLGSAGRKAINDPSFRIWEGEGVFVLVTLDESGCVATKSWNDLSKFVNIREETFWDKLRRWVGH